MFADIDRQRATDDDDTEKVVADTGLLYRGIARAKSADGTFLIRGVDRSSKGWGEDVGSALKDNSI